MDDIIHMVEPQLQQQHDLTQPHRLQSLLAIQDFTESTPPPTANQHDGPPSVAAKAKQIAFSCSEGSELDGFTDSNGTVKATCGGGDPIDTPSSLTISCSSSSDDLTSNSTRSQYQLPTPTSLPSALASDGSSQDEKICCSAEISDQDARCQRELKHRKFNLDNVMATVSHVSDFTIEPSSSESDRQMQQQPPPTQRTPVVFTRENSSNAVDNKISVAIELPAQIDRADLSFNGRINTIASTSNVVVPTDNSNNYMQINEQSPDMFAAFDCGDSGDDDDDEQSSTMAQCEEPSNDDCPTAESRDIHETDKIILSRIQKSLSGVLPPPSVTILQYDIKDILQMYRTNYRRFTYAATDGVAAEPRPSTSKAIHPFELTSSSSWSPSKRTISLFRPTHTQNEIEHMKWPKCIDEVRGPGIYYNRSVHCENVELLCMKYAERHIGAETMSSFTRQSPSSCKKRNMRMK